MDLKSNVGPAIIITYNDDIDKRLIMLWCDTQDHLTVEYVCNGNDITITPLFWNVEIMLEASIDWTKFCRELCQLINGEDL